MAYSKQTWSDTPGQTPINATRLNHMEDGIADNEVDYIIKTASTSAPDSIRSTGSDYTIDLDRSVSVGNSLTLSQSGIKIGSGINRVRFSAMVSFDSVTTGKKVLKVYKNTTLIGCATSYVNENGSVSLPQRIVTVSENDIIYLKINGTSGDSISALEPYTFLTVEKIN